MTVFDCPVCWAPMREANHQGVLIDTCTQCRGVWLDRGELQKIATALDGDPAPRSIEPGDRRDDRGHDRFDDDDRGDRDRDGTPRKSKLSRLMDFFG